MQTDISITWRVTEPSGRAHTASGDDGRTGWKRHAVKPDGTAACGLKPKRGWGGDLFEDGMDECVACRKALGTYCRPCNGTGREMFETRPRHQEGRPCRACGGSGNPKNVRVRHAVPKATAEERRLAREGDSISAVAAIRKRTSCTLAEAYAACRAEQDVVHGMCGCFEFTTGGRRARHHGGCVHPGAPEHEFIPCPLPTAAP